MKDLKFIELLTDTIYYPFKNEIVELSTLTEKEPLQLRVTTNLESASTIPDPTLDLPALLQADQAYY